MVLTVNKVIKAAYKKILTSSLCFSAIQIKVNMTDRFPGSESSNDQRIPVRMDDIDIVSVSFIKTNVGGVAFKQGTRRVQPRDPAQVPQLLPHEAGDVGAQGEAHQVGVVGDALPALRAQAVDHRRHLKQRDGLY